MKRRRGEINGNLQVSMRGQIASLVCREDDLGQPQLKIFIKRHANSTCVYDRFDTRVEMQLVKLARGDSTLCWNTRARYTL